MVTSISFSGARGLFGKPWPISPNVYDYEQERSGPTKFLITTPRTENAQERVGRHTDSDEKAFLTLELKKHVKSGIGR